MLATSSRALARSCRRRRPPPRLARAHPDGCGNFNHRAGWKSGVVTCVTDSSRSALSTVSFDGGAFDVSWANDAAGSQSSSPPLAQMLSPTRRLSKHPQPHHFRRQTQQWIATNPKIAGYKAEEALSRLWEEQKELFRRWEEQQQQQQQMQTPSADSSESAPAILLTTESVNLVLQAWCRSNNGEIGAERAERLLHWMEDLSAAESVEPAWGPFLPQPDYRSYATVIDAWSRAAAYESANPSRSAADATESKSGGRVSQSTKAGFECAKRAEELLMHMQRMHERRLQTTEGGEGSDNYNSDVQPDTRVFDLVLAGWSGVHGGTKASAIRAMRILDLMQELHHAQSREAPEWHDVALSKVQPNLSTYKAVLTAWARAARTLEGPDRAEEILRHMLSLSKAGNLGAEILPDVEGFHIVMKAHADAIRERRKGDDGSSSAERARKVTALLDWMELLSLRGRTAKIRPTTETYRIALSAWVWSHHVDAPREAEGILYRMIHAGDEGEEGANSLAVGVVGGAKRPHESSSVRPETRDFNTLINCCSFARRVGADKSSQDDESLLRMQLEHEEVFDVAEGALQTLLSVPYVQPDSATFAGIIRACVNLVPNTDDRDDRVIELFRLAYRTTPSDGPGAKASSTATERMRAPPGAGCVDANVLRQLRHALPSTEDYIRVREEFEEHRRQNLKE